jgi:hypothetical protein
VIATVSPLVAEGLGELECEFGPLGVEPDDVGGAYVTLQPHAIGSGWNLSNATLTFHLPYNYPAAAPYPYYLPGDVAPTGAWPPALQAIQWRDRAVLQVSLRHNNWDPERDRVRGCVTQVLDWLRRQ